MRKLLVVVLSLAMFCTACSTGWVLALDSILAAAAPALVNILQIVAVANGQPVNAGCECISGRSATRASDRTGGRFKHADENNATC